MRYRTIKQAYLHVLVFSLVLVGTALSQAARAQTTGVAPSQEYFVQQQADESLVIRIGSFEAEIESRVFGPQRSLLSVSALPGNRIAPLYQFIGATSKARQLDIEVTARQGTGNSRFDIEFTRLSAWDERSKQVVRAYHLLAYAMQSAEVPGSTDWSINVSSALSAARIFAQYGMREQRLWATYLASYLLYYRLGDYPFAARLNDKVLEEAGTSTWQDIKLAALQLKADILIKLGNSDAAQDPGGGTDSIQTALYAAAQLAGSMNFGFEQASAVYKSGLVYAGQGHYPQALAQYQNALQLAQPLADPLFAKEIRESLVAVNARQGNSPASGPILQQIETQLLREGGGDELALNLLQQADLFLDTHRFPQAIEVLAQALDQQNDSSIRSRANLALARASYENGDADAALAYLEAAGVRNDVRPAGQGNDAPDIITGLGIRAAIYRARGEYGPMQQARQSQQSWLQTGAERGRFNYQRGLDALGQGGGTRVQAAAFFRKSYQEAGHAGRTGLRSLAQLQLCALGVEDTGLCTPDRSSQAYEKLVSGSIPRQVAEARFLRARYLAGQGRKREALALMEQAVDDIHFYRQVMPGMLGAWYWQRHGELFAAYLDLTGITSASEASGKRDFESLLAITRVRFAARPAASESGPDPQAQVVADVSLRERIAALENMGPGEATAETLPAIRQDVAGLRAGFAQTFGYLTRTGLRKALDGLANDEAILTYHITDGQALAWLGTRGQVRRFVLQHPGRIVASLQRARHSLPTITGQAFDDMMKEVGDQLMQPLVGSLPATIYFIPAGLLTGFPIDALRLGQDYLLEHHRVVNVLAFPFSPTPGASLHMNAPQRVFLAGSPRDYSAEVESSLVTSGEIQAVAEPFVGPGLRIVQGRALLPDEFQGAALQRADLVHLSMPAVIDLEQPLRSGLMLSEPQRDAGRQMLSLAGIRQTRLQAALVFLSASRIQGDPGEAYFSQPALVTGYLGAGAHAVIAASWRPASQVATELVSGFYRSLTQANDIATALAQSKRDYIRAHYEEPTRDWAAYQLYIR